MSGTRGDLRKFKKSSQLNNTCVMREIIPAILEKQFIAIKDKVELLDRNVPEVKWVQLDIMDGRFVPNTTWHLPADLTKLSTRLKVEVHLMVMHPALLVTDWLAIPLVQRFLIHRESMVDDDQLWRLIDRIKNQGAEVGLVLNPGTPVSSIKNYLGALDTVLLMGVNPGFSGQSFDWEILPKIKELRALTSLPLAVDGGVNLETAPRILAAGASRLCVASYLWGSQGYRRAVMNLLELGG